MTNLLKDYPSIWDTINRIQLTLGLSHEILADMMRLTEKQYHSLRLVRRDPSIMAGMALAQAINIGIESLVTNKIDYKALAHHFGGNKIYVPEKYLEAAYSKRRTVINLLNYIESRFGFQAKHQVLRTYQMTEPMFHNPDDPINLRFSVDITKWLLQYINNENIFVDMGKHAVDTNRHTAMGAELTKARHIKELFEIMFNSVAEKYIEKNFHWTISALTPQRVRIKGVPHKDLIGLLGKKYMYSYYGCLIRKGFIASIPAYLHYPSAPITKTACVAEGHDHCEFHVDLQPYMQKRKPSYKPVHHH